MRTRHDSITLREELTQLRKQRHGNEKIWEKARVILVEVALNRIETTKILPLMMFLTPEAKGTLFIADYPKNTFTMPYREAGLMIHVRTPLGSGLHCAWMLVDDDIAMAHGRELLGYPKKLGRFMFKEESLTIRAGVHRGGSELIRMDARLKEPEAQPEPVFDIKTMNVHSYGPLFFMHPIWAFRPKESILTSHAAAMEVTLNYTDADPVARYVDGLAPDGRVVTLDITGCRYLFPVGLAGLFWFARTHMLRNSHQTQTRLD